MKKNKLEGEFIGGLRRISAVVTKHPQGKPIAKDIRKWMEKHFNQDEGLLRRCLGAVGSESPEAGPTKADLDRLRRELGSLLGTSDVAALDPVRDNSEVCAGLLEKWAERAHDVDIEASTWARCGAPAGILEHPGQPGVFPDAVEPGDLIDPALQHFDPPETRYSYETVEDCPHALEELNRLVAAGFVRRFASLEACRDFLGGDDPKISKFGQVIRERDGKTKRRLILDSKESGITRCARKHQRIVLPTVNDYIFDALDMMAAGMPTEGLIMDVTDAFWSLPLRKGERKFFCGKLRGQYYLYLRLAQGSRGAPLSWCRFYALICRLTQAMYAPSEARMNTYVDDPATVIAGEQGARDYITAGIILIWRLLGLRLAFRKGQRGEVVDWIGFQIKIRACGKPWAHVQVTLKEETFRQLVQLLDEARSKNVLGTKFVRSLAGKISNVSRLLVGWRPFLADFWGAIAEADRTKSPRIWTRQIFPALCWFSAFCRREHAGIERTFALDAYLAPSSHVQITIDASPWGYGAVLVVDRKPVQYFAIPVTQADADRLGVSIGESDSQQAFECMTAVIALKTWWPFWQSARCALRVRGDNVTLLTMLADYKAGGSGGTVAVARELSLFMAAACYRPVAATHLAGVANVVADECSRRFDPQYRDSWTPHIFLQEAVEVQPEDRTEEWWLSAQPPAAAPPPAAGGKRRGRRGAKKK